nr:hypothetical protein [Tanacetum cinerariifolium]
MIVAGNRWAWRRNVDRDRGGAGVAIGVTDGVREHVLLAMRADQCRVAVIGRIALGVDDQRAVQPGDHAAQTAR